MASQQGHRHPGANDESQPAFYPFRDYGQRTSATTAARSGLFICHHFHLWRQSAGVSMHIDHKAGEKLFVDYARHKLAIVDPDRGAGQPVETFVATLGASELTYVEARATQQGEDWIRSNERALRYCGGGTEVMIPDNLRSAVSRSDPYEPGINPQFDAFAQHYGVVIMPARGTADLSAPLRAVAEPHLRLP